MERKIVDYMCPILSSEDSLTGFVKDRIKDGWQPFGGPHIIYCPGEGYESPYCFAQAMVKYAD